MACIFLLFSSKYPHMAKYSNVQGINKNKLALTKDRFAIKTKQGKHFLVSIDNCCNVIASKKETKGKNKTFYPKNMDLGDQIANKIR